MYLYINNSLLLQQVMCLFVPLCSGLMVFLLLALLLLPFAVLCCALCLFWQYSKLHNSAYLLLSWVASLAGIFGKSGKLKHVRTSTCMSTCMCARAHVSLHVLVVLLPK